MEAEAAVEVSERVAKLSTATFCLMVSAVGVAALCLVLHSHVHGLACALRIVAMILGGLALLKIVNSVAAIFPSFLARPIHWIHALVFEIPAFALVVLLRLHHYLNPFDEPAGRKEGPPILLVHGYINTSSVWIYLRHCLARDGFGPIYTIDLRHPFQSIEAHAETIAKKAEEIRKETGRDDLTLIGHSMGGLVSAYYALHLAPPNSVSGITTLASPLKGTYVAKIALGADGREMERDSEFVLDLNEEMAKSQIPFYTIAARTDQLVVPYTSCLLDSARQCTFDDVGHIGLLFSPRVANQLKSWLSEKQ